LAAALLTAAPSAFAAAADYRFELAGQPQKSGDGKNVISIKLVHVPDGKPVTGAIIVQSRADMGPIGMAAMTGPIAALGEQPPGTYRFEVRNGTVWKRPDNWALSFAAKIQGEAGTVTGNVIVKLSP